MVQQIIVGWIDGEELLRASRALIIAKVRLATLLLRTQVTVTRVTTFHYDDKWCLEKFQHVN